MLILGLSVSLPSIVESVSKFVSSLSALSLISGDPGGGGVLSFSCFMGGSGVSGL
jgi:hypothetical protein